MLATAPDTVIVPYIPAPAASKATPSASNLHQPLSDDDTHDMLSYLDPDMDYSEWLKIGMALHAAGHSCELWDEWSRGGRKYEAGICASKWESFCADGMGKVGIGTFIHMAREAGWKGNADLSLKRPAQFIDPSNLEGKIIPQREWIVENWFPQPYATAFYGDGGTGKSLLAMQLMTAAATGKYWLGQPVKQVKALGFFCEDTDAELHYRQAQINKAYGCSFTDLKNMVWYSGVGEDNTLVTFDNGNARLTSLFEQVKQKVHEFGAQLVVIDTAADTFGGNENARRDVRMFISQLNKLALEINGAVVLCAHPSAAGMSSGRGDGGNIAWNNSVRSRLYLHRPHKEGEEARPGDENIRILSRKKSNYAAANDELTLLWQDGVFITLGAAGSAGNSLTKTNREKLAEENFLKAMDDYAMQERPLSCGKTAGNYAPKMMMKNPRCIGFNKKELEAAMERLFSKRQIKNEAYGRGVNQPKRIVKT